MLLHLFPAFMHFPTGIFFINSLVYLVYLFSLTSSFSTLLGVSFQNFQTSFHFIFLIFLLIHLDHKTVLEKYIKDKDTILAGGKWQSPLLLTFTRAILKFLLFISTLLLPILSFQTLSPLHCSPNPLQLGYIPLLVLHQILERLPNSSVFLHEFSEYLFNGT